MWSERASPVSWIGPRRFASPGVRFEDLPKIDFVLLSHNHYDHLDIPTLRRIAAAHTARFIVPVGVSPLLLHHGIKPEPELDWWQAADSVTCVPAFHFSARGLQDRNRTLWCGYWLKTAAGPIYFAADTAFGPHFGDIRNRLGSPRLALLPIGAYKPEWFMGPVHMSPDEAVKAHRILVPQRSIAIHWGTFQLADDGRHEPVEALRRALDLVPESPPFDALENGAVVEVA